MLTAVLTSAPLLALCMLAADPKPVTLLRRTFFPPDLTLHASVNCVSIVATCQHSSYKLPIGTGPIDTV